MRQVIPRCLVALLALCAATCALADVFTNKKTGKKVIGVLLGKGTLAGQEYFVVKDADGHCLKLATAEWLAETGTVERLRACFIELVAPLENAGVKKEIVNAIRRAGDLRAQLVVIEIDTPGGFIEHAQEVCCAIEALKGAKRAAFIKGGSSRGAFSAGALVALACDVIYMADGACIGAAAPFVWTDNGPQFTQKLTSAFSAMFRSLAEKHGKPAPIAAAMVDTDVELREVTLDGKTHFVAPDRAKELARAGAQVGAWEKRKGSLLTLTAREAVALGFADGIANSRQELLTALGAANARVIDLRTDMAIKPWLAAANLRRDIVNAWLDAIRCDPAGYKYDLVEKYVGPSVSFDGSVRGGYTYWTFADGGLLWKRRTDACVAKIDVCLGLLRKYLDMARRNPKLGISVSQLVKIGRRLAAWKRDLISTRYRLCP